MLEVSGVVLGSLNRLPDEERAVLVGTLRTWLASGGSVDTTAKTLFCHLNTVRYRLNRVTEHTGRSLTDPHAVTELTLALHADYLRPPGGPAARPLRRGLSTAVSALVTGARRPQPWGSGNLSHRPFGSRDFLPNGPWCMSPG